MVKELKNVDFCTTGRQPSEQEFARISEWITQDKQKQAHSIPEPMPTEEELATVSESLSEDYKSDEELTAFTKLDGEPFREMKLGIDYTINPELDGKYDNDPYFQEKLDRANEIIERCGVPKFPERPKKQ